MHNNHFTYSSNIAYVEDTGCDDIGNGDFFVKSVSGISVSSLILTAGRHTTIYVNTIKLAYS